MRVNLNQAEIFQAITNFVRSKWKLEDATTVEISLTAGRSPKGYTADVEITYPEDAPSNITTRVVEDDEQPLLPADTAGVNSPSLGSNPHAEALASTTEATTVATSAGTASAGNLFG